MNNEARMKATPVIAKTTIFTSRLVISFFLRVRHSLVPGYSNLGRPFSLRSWAGLLPADEIARKDSPGALGVPDADHSGEPVNGHGKLGAIFEDLAGKRFR